MKKRILTDKELEKYKEILEKEKEETLKVLRDISTTRSKGAKNESGDLSSYSTHQADHGTDTDSLEKEVYHLETLQRKLKEINQALKRIFDKTYGVCELCGDDIEEKRLDIVPYANMCISCKTEEEEKISRRR